MYMKCLGYQQYYREFVCFFNMDINIYILKTLTGRKLSAIFATPIYIFCVIFEQTQKNANFKNFFNSVTQRQTDKMTV